MHRNDRRKLVTVFARVPITIAARVMSLPILVLGVILIYQGANEAHVINGLALNLDWSESTPEAKLIFGFIILWLAQPLVGRMGRRRRGGSTRRTS